MSEGRTTGDGLLPGDGTARQMVAAMIRVDHAGEYGARRIYDGQLAVLEGTPAGEAIRAMARQEQKHLDHFDRLVAERGVRPTALAPLWHVAGYALGVASALMGEKAAMAATAAVESVIDEHYGEQACRLGDDEAELRATVEEFRADEREHHDTALAFGAAEAPAHALLDGAVRAGTRLAIWLSTRL